MRTRLIPIIVIPIVVAVIIVLILALLHMSASSITARPLLEELEKYYKNNSTIHITEGKTIIRLLSVTGMTRGLNVEKVYLYDINIGHSTTQKMKIYFIKGRELTITYLSSSLAQTVIYLRNFTYIFYIDRSLGKAYECFKGFMRIEIGSSRNIIRTSGICFIYNLSETPYDLSYMYYNHLLNIFKKFNCRKEDGNISCILRTDIDYAKLLREELDMIVKMVPKYKINIESISKNLSKLSKPCNVYARVTILSSMFMSREDVVCRFEKTSFEVSSLSEYTGLSMTHVNVLDIIREVQSFRKIIIERNLSRSSLLMHLLLGVDLLRNVPEPFAIVQVLNMPVGLVLVLAMLHIY
ncbi:MAG: hypothetical protein GXO26_06210 [Crenarchaeota archaeon]|nr:hypothetical protein [Thermoproteota archaeon]